MADHLTRRIGSLVPVDGIAAVTAVTDQRGHVQKNRVVNISYPSEWIEIYERHHYTEIDPIVKRHFATFELQKWSETLARASSETDHNFWEEAKRFGLSSGITIGMPDARNLRASLFSFCGSGMEHDPRHLLILKYILPHLHEAFFKSSFGSELLRTEVSGREKEVLKWATHGKTNWEIAQILRISERTVKFHLANLAAKLNARGRSHIVAVALSRGIIEF